jgi:hypothetical protein
MEDCAEAGVAMTNYGLLLAFAASPQALLRAVRPYGVKVPQRLVDWAPIGKIEEETAPPPSCQEHLLLSVDGEGKGKGEQQGGGGCSRRECPLCVDVDVPVEKEGTEAAK